MAVETTYTTRSEYIKKYGLEAWKKEYGNDSVVTEVINKPNVNTSDYIRKAEDIALEENKIVRYSRKETNMFSEHRSRVIDDDVAVIDKDWISSRFMTPGSELTKLDALNRFFTSTSWKTTSTALGRSMAINSRPQFTRYADMKGYDRGLLATGTSMWRPVTKNYSTKLGMGRYYSESIDDNAEQIYVEFGLAKFNSLITVMTRAVDYVDSYIANHGHMPVGYYVGYAIAGWARFWAFPLVSTIIFAGKLVFNAVYGGRFQYYYMEPAMHAYYSAVNQIVSQMAIELGIMHSSFMASGEEAHKIGVPMQLDTEDMGELKQLMPNIFSETTNYIDVFKIVAGPQTFAFQQFKKEFELYKNSNGESAKDMIGYLVKGGSAIEAGAVGTAKMDYLNEFLSFDSFLNKIVRDKNSWYSKSSEDVENELSQIEKQTAEELNNSNTATTISKKDGSTVTDDDGNELKATNYSQNPDGSIDSTIGEETWLDMFSNTFDSYIRDGMAFAIFNVDFTGSMSDSVTNSVGEIGTGSGIKELAKGARHMKFNLAGGNLAGDLIGDVVGAVKNVAMGALDAVTFGLSNVLNTIMGGGYISLPKAWEDSDVSLATTTYTMDLVSPYGNPISQLQNIYIPLAMIMAGSFPLKAGESSYTSPFLCKLYNKGKEDIQLGMITSVTIERGTGNLAYTRNKRPLAFKVSFTVTNLAPTVTAPIQQSIFQELFNFNIHDEGTFGHYIGTLCSRDLYSSKYFKPKMVRKLSRMSMAFSQAISPNQQAALVGGVLYPFLSPFLQARHISASQLNGRSNTIS